MIYLSIILIYLLTLVGLGLYKAKKIKTQSDFAVAGRTLTPWMALPAQETVVDEDAGDGEEPPPES